VAKVGAREIIWRCERLFCSPPEEQLSKPIANLEIFLFDFLTFSYICQNVYENKILLNMMVYH